MTSHFEPCGGDACSLVVLARAPELGRVKTRLAGAIGAAAAFSVYQQLVAITAAVAAGWRGPVMVAADGSAAGFAGSGLDRFPAVGQPEGPFGVRLAAAMRAGRELAAATIVIGTDCPGLDHAALQCLTTLLREAPVAFGPAHDGGFWGIATNDVRTADLIDRAPVRWSASTTLAELREHLAAGNLASQLGPMLADCDTAADLERAQLAGLLPTASRRGASG